ncbi:MAG: AAA family ATPase [Chloroflexi bacterium]|nr:AAA family ATPase [Chloroflexota bacterium]
MHLKYLDLHGYKTFANKTDFAFDSGITAVVGPNGSGKSNLADAVRWVLGEQSSNALRVKKTQDLIFSGSGARPRLGMAEVSMTLENPDPWQATEGTESIAQHPVGTEEKTRARDPVTELLRTNPSEVTIGRRAYRDGDNEYFLNGSRVRLRDIHELLARWGLARNTYAVVGQGLVDQALSLRPEERRALFEEAAGIMLYQSKRQNALDKLEETQKNLLRVNDIINEIAPRLPSLARQAERARNYDGVVKLLDDKLRLWYAFQWARAQQVIQDVAAREKSTREILNARRAEVQGLAAQLAQLRRQGQELRNQLAEGRRARSLLEGEYATRTRELAVLAERLRFMTQQRDEAVAEVAGLLESRHRQEEKIAQATAELEQHVKTRDSFVEQLREKEKELRELEHLAASAEALEAESEPQFRELARKLADLRSQLSVYEEGLRVAASLSARADVLANFEIRRAQAVSNVEMARNQITELRAALAIAERDVAGARAAVESARSAMAQWEAQIAARQRRVDSFTRDVEGVDAQRELLQARVDESARALAEIDARVAPAEAQLAAAEKRQAELEEQESLQRTRLAEFEENHNRAVLDVERSRAEIARLETEIEDDLTSGRIVSEIKIEEDASGSIAESIIAIDSDLPQQLRLRLGDEVVALPVVTAVPEGLEKEIRKLRNQLKYMGSINPNAPQEYDELKARHQFLTEQTADAHRAIESLNKAISELDEIMRRKFEETFKAINKEFAFFFTLLFNGGTARLELTQPEDLSQTGIDIIAKPPGKRAAHLAILSGGERALTAAALLFAILKVSPTPFCVLDEVDAMLDEANVGRFRDALKTLSAQTQFIVITHNRTTMESADTVYGITMSDDGVSQAMSLRLDGNGNGKQTVNSEQSTVNSEQ